MRTLHPLLILLLSVSAYADEVKLPTTTVSTPDTPTPLQPTVIDTVGVNVLYIIESQIPIEVLSFPDESVTIITAEGPIRPAGVFADSNGKFEIRTYTAPFVSMVVGFKPTKVELAVIPRNFSKKEDIIRQKLTISGIGPNPPPTPDDPVEPDDPPQPPTPVTSFRVIFVVESGDTLSAGQTAVAAARDVREYLTAKTTKEDNLSGWRVYDPQQTTDNEKPQFADMWKQVKDKIQTVPCMVIEKNGKITVTSYPENVAAALTKLKEYGG